METTIISPVMLTPGAITQVKKLMAADGFDSNKSLRIGVKGGGCSGMTYILDFENAKETDEHFEMGGIPCIINKSHAIYLQGMTIDWQEGLNNRGFVFQNPNASATCGCGTSFAV